MNIQERLQKLLEEEAQNSIIPTEKYHVLFEALMRIIALEKQLEKKMKFKIEYYDPITSNLVVEYRELGDWELAEDYAIQVSQKGWYKITEFLDSGDPRFIIEAEKDERI